MRQKNTVPVRTFKIKPDLNSLRQGRNSNISRGGELARIRRKQQAIFKNKKHFPQKFADRLMPYQMFEKYLAKPARLTTYETQCNFQIDPFRQLEARRFAKRAPGRHQYDPVNHSGEAGRGDQQLCSGPTTLNRQDREREVREASESREEG
jgi:hypothetical protein